MQPNKEQVQDIISHLIVQQHSSKYPMSGCYAKNPSLQRPKQHLAVPIKHMDYRVLLANSVAQVTLEQQYENSTNLMLELEYLFPIDPSACVTEFKATFGESEIIGLVKDKKEAKGDYERGLREGRQVAYGEINAKSRDIMCLKIGNVPPKTTVKLTISFMQTLEVSLNMFWHLCIQAFIWPRYINDPSAMLPSTHPSRNLSWTFKVQLKSSKPITLWQCPSHKLSQLARTPNELSLVLPESEIPSRDFQFLYTTQNFQLPSLTCGKTDVSQSCIISLIPRYSQMTIEDAKSKQETDFIPNMDTVRGEFIFLLDRSGSMQGGRIEKAKQALVFFIRSLPKYSYFNVVSFGTRFKTLFDSSRKYDDSSAQSAIKSVSQFSANMDGTEIAEPLKRILTQKPIKSYPKHVFLLTDGAVSNTQAIKDLVKDYNHHARVHAIGVGNGASTALIKGCAQNGKGRAVFLSDNEDVADKIVELLQSVLSPVITEFEFGFDQSIVDCVIPNPKEIPYITKNEPLCLYVMFKPGFQGSTSFKFKYADSVNHKTYQSTIAYSGKDEEFTFVDKMAHHRQLQILCDCIKSQKSVNNDMLMSEVADLRSCAVQGSVKNQVLCDYTAFVCVGKFSKKADEVAVGTSSWKVEDQQSWLRKQDQARIAKKNQQAIDKMKAILNDLQQIESISCSISRELQTQNQMLCSIDQQSDYICNSGAQTIQRFDATKATHFQKKSSGFGSKIAKGFQGIGNFFSNIFGFKKSEEHQDIKTKSATIEKQVQQQKKEEQQQISNKEKLKHQIKYSKKDQKQQCEEVVSYQQTDGSWDEKGLKSICLLLELTHEQIEQIVTDTNSNIKFVLTVLAIQFLNLKGTKKYSLIIKKGKDWILNQKFTAKETQAIEALAKNKLIEQ